MTDLQKQLKGKATIIGVTGESASTVRSFVEKQGNKMDYTVAVDSSGQTNRAWMDAAGARGIPHAFIVIKNKIAFSGHPSSPEFEKILSEGSGGRYDPELQKKVEPWLEQLDYARRMQDWRAYDDYFSKIMAESSWVFNDTAIRKFKIWVLEKKDAEGAIEYARGPFIDLYREDSETIAKLAETILTTKEIVNSSPEDLRKLALFLANEAASGAGATEPEFLRVKALALYHNGEYDEAIAVQERAYFIAEPERKAEFKRLLDAYRSGTAMRRGR